MFNIVAYILLDLELFLEGRSPYPMLVQLPAQLRFSNKEGEMSNVFIGHSILSSIGATASSSHCGILSRRFPIGWESGISL